MLEGAAGASTAVPGQSFPSDTGHRGASDPSAFPNSTPSLPLPVSVGRRLLWGRGWVWEKEEREEQREPVSVSSSVQPPPLFSVKWEEGA